MAEYEKLRAEYTRAHSQNALNALGEWFDRYANGNYWNGECYDADGIDIYPVYRYDVAAGACDVIGYTEDRDWSARNIFVNGTEDEWFENYG